jgi:hypothetical protein
LVERTFCVRRVVPKIFILPLQKKLRVFLKIFRKIQKKT